MNFLNPDDMKYKPRKSISVVKIIINSKLIESIFTNVLRDNL